MAKKARLWGSARRRHRQLGSVSSAVLNRVSLDPGGCGGLSGQREAWRCALCIRWSPGCDVDGFTELTFWNTRNGSLYFRLGLLHRLWQPFRTRQDDHMDLLSLAKQP